MNDFEFLEVYKSDRLSFIKSWECAFSRSLDSQVYDWIFNDENLMYALRINNEIAAGYCLYPLSCILNQKKEIALLCNNVFVNPKYQGKQLFVRLSKLALKEARDKGLGSVAFGIPNRLALPGHKRVGWGVQPPIAFLETNRHPRCYGIRENWRKHTLTNKDRAGIESCSISSSQNRSFSILKSKCFVKWRFESKPNAKYWFGLKYRNSDLIAYAVCKYFPEGKVLHFVDVDGTDSDAIIELINESHYIPGDFNRINIWESSAHRKIFVDYGFVTSSSSNNFILINPHNMEPVHFLESSNITLADNDVY